MIWGWNDYHWDMRVVHTIFTDTAEEFSAQCPHTTRTHHYKVRLVILCQFTDHFSRSVALFLVQLEVQLQENPQQN